MRESLYRNYLLGVLLFALICNFAERAFIGLALQDIKSEFRLSDTQLGLLTGIAFSLFYAVMGIPVARWADRGNRILIISLMTVLQCVAMGMSGLATGFIQLLLIRIVVAAGEAGCVPPAHSLIADHFSRADRPRAVARYLLGSPLSIIAGYFFAGWLMQLYGWRWTFFLLGLPGLVLAAVAWFTLREPRLERRTQAGEGDRAKRRSTKSVSMALWSVPTFRHLLVGFSVLYFFLYGIMKWQPTFFSRAYGMQSGELGTWFAVIWGGAALLGTYLGGELATRYAANNERLQLRAAGVAFASLAVISPLVYLSTNRYAAFGAMGLTGISLYMTVGPLFATMQTLVVPDMRAMSVALIYLFANLIGLGLGPLAVGALSDALRPLVGEESLRYALLCLCPGYLWCAWQFWQASRTVTRDLAEAQEASGLG